MAYANPFDDDVLSLLGRLSLGTRPRHGTPQSQVHDKENLQMLYRKAKVYVANKGANMRVCSELYRDKSRTYFNDIIHSKQGVMKTYQKDYHGDPKSPANGRLNGLFFTANVDPLTGAPPLRSIYGERRFIIPIKRVLDKVPNAYFTDFYCVRKATHYVTVILTTPGSVSDSFCRKHLIPFDLEDNPFFCRSAFSFFGGESFKVTDGLWVELLVTEDINLDDEQVRGAHWQDVMMRGKRSGGSIGLVKNAYCPHCNI